MPDDLFNPPVNKAAAKRILTELRLGQPPHEYVGVINVGYDRLLDYFRIKLDEIRDFGLSDVKFINGNYGRGKSHFLDLVRLLAFERNFVVSRVGLNQRDVPFDKLEVVIQQIIANIATYETRVNGFENLLREWAKRQARKSEQDIYRSLDAVSMPDLRMNLVEYARAHNADPVRITGLLKWFRGEETKSKTFTSVQQYLHALTQFFRDTGYSGFVIMLDEAEAISSLTRGKRGEIANENIRQIIDNTSGTEGFYFVFASTPTFFEPPPGGMVRPGDPVSIYSYPALRRRVEHLIGVTDPLSPHSVIVELPELGEEDLLCLAGKIRDLAILADGEPASPLTDADLAVLVRYVKGSEVATLVRSAVAICDRARQAGFSFRNEFEMIVGREQEQVHRTFSQ